MFQRSLDVARWWVLIAATSASHAQTEIRDASAVRFAAGFPSPSARSWPADAPAVRFYFRDGASAPSCGLLVDRTKLIVSLVEPDEGMDFPQCIGVPSALVLQRGTVRYFLLRVTQKDTREDSSQTDLLFVERHGIPEPVNDLSATTAPPSTQPLSQVAAWLRARWSHPSPTRKTE